MEILRPVILHPFRDTVLSFVPYPSGKAEVSVFSAAEGKWMPVMRAEANEGKRWKTDDRSPKNEEKEWLEISGDAAYEILEV